MRSDFSLNAGELPTVQHGILEPTAHVSNVHMNRPRRRLTHKSTILCHSPTSTMRCTFFGLATNALNVRNNNLSLNNLSCPHCALNNGNSFISFSKVEEYLVGCIRCHTTLPTANAHTHMHTHVVAAASGSISSTCTTVGTNQSKEKGTTPIHPQNAITSHRPTFHQIFLQPATANNFADKSMANRMGPQKLTNFRR